MRNLFERLKPEYVEILNKTQDLYPNATANTIFELKCHNFWCDLPYSCIYFLLDNLDIYDYSPKTIESIFKND